MAIVSPFIDKTHGTERMVAEWIAQLAGAFELHIYSQSVEDVDLTKTVWHRIPKLPGPHLFNYLWWFAANPIWRAWDRYFRGLQPDVIFSPGINCLDADAISIHIVFAQMLRRVGPELAYARNSVRAWPRLLHRRLYYALIVMLERRIYSDPGVQLILTSPQSAAELAEFYGRREPLPIIDNGIDQQAFNPERREALRGGARRSLCIADGDFAVLLVGNDWRKKGLLTLLDAIASLAPLPVRLLVVSRESADLDQALRASPNVRAIVLPLRKDVEFYYAAADAYAGPSIEDTFALPVAEAMSCGLPAIASSVAGVSQTIEHGVNGFVLGDPRDSAALAGMLRQLYENHELRRKLGEKAAETAAQFTWENSGRQLAEVLNEIVRRKERPASQTLPHET